MGSAILREYKNKNKKQNGKKREKCFKKKVFVNHYSSRASGKFRKNECTI